MKSLAKTFLTASLVFLFSAFGFSQATITIKLIVDTANFDKDNLPSSCRFEATWSDSNKVVKSTPGDLEGFLIDAFAEDTIIWVGQSSSSDITIIDITKIKYKKGTRIFKNKTNYGKNHDGSRKETVKTKVVDSTKGKPDYKYDLSFKINKGNTHKIDPKIRIGSRN